MKYLSFISTSLYSMLETFKNEDKIAKHICDIQDAIKTHNTSESNNPNAWIDSKLTGFARQITLKLSEEFLVSYLPEGKEPEIHENGNWGLKDRQVGKPGKIFRKALKTSFTNAELERFVYRLKAVWADRGYKFELISGESIRYYYHENNYYRCTNTLGNSCMSHAHCQEYFDLYVNQPECQMLVALKEGKLAGRALVWTIDNKTFMDRCYYIEDCLLNMFINYAKNHKWLIREDNCLLSDGDDQYFLGPDDNYKDSFEGNFALKLKTSYKYMPYIDTFRYYDVCHNILHTSQKSGTNCCSFTDGRYEEEFFECPHCYNSHEDEDEIVYSCFDGVYCCTDCALWSEYLDDWFISSATAVYDVKYSWIKDNIPASYVHSHPEEFVTVDGKLYLADDYEN